MIANGDRLLASCCNPELPAAADELAGRFAAARPFRHLVIDDFLEPDFAAQLERTFPRFDEKLAVNEDGQVGGKAVNEKPADLGPAWRRLHELVQRNAFRSLVGRITGIPALVFDPWYFGGGTHENRHGQDLDPHVDFNFHPITGEHRRLNLILYLERDWLPAWGGALDLHRNPRLPPAEDEIVRVSVAFNRAVIFETTESSWHGFERIDLPEAERHRTRRSFALYYYTENRPAEETGKPHSTIYVERHLPDRFAPGVTLQEDDLRVLRTLLSRRDQHLERLYRHVTDLTDRLSRLEGRARGRTGGGVDQLDRPALEERYRDAARQLEELRGSNSWRITRPLRALARLLRRGR